MTKLNVNDSGTWREIKEVYVKNSGSWQQIDEVHVNDSGTWRKVFQAGWIIGTGDGQVTFYTFVTELIDAYGDAVLSAGPLSGDKAEGTTGTWEIILAPGYRLSGDTGDTASYTGTYSVRYLFTVAADGSATQNSASGSQGLAGSSAMADYVAGTTRISVALTDISTLDEAHFTHIVEWGNSSASTRSSTFTWNPPSIATNILVSGIGGGGGGGNGGGYGISNSASGGGGGGSGAVYVNQSASNAEFTITLAQGGTSGGALNYNQQNTREDTGTTGGTTTVLVNGSSLFSAAGGFGGLGGFNAAERENEDGNLENPDTGNTGGSGRSPNGASGGKGSYRLRALSGTIFATGGVNQTVNSFGFAGSSNATTGQAGGLANSYGSSGGSGGGGGGGGFASGGNSSNRGYLGSGGGGGGGEQTGKQGGDGYVKVTWTS